MKNEIKEGRTPNAPWNLIIRKAWAKRFSACGTTEELPGDCRSTTRFLCAKKLLNGSLENRYLESAVTGIFERHFSLNAFLNQIPNDIGFG